MTESIDARTAAREAELTEQLSGQRRLARPEDYLFDKREVKFWDLLDGTLHEEKSVDASIPLEFWRVVVNDEPDDAAPRGRGRPRARERLIKPTMDIMRVENDQFVEGSTWWPGRPQVINDWFVDKDGFYPAPGRRIYNQFKAAPILEGDATKAGPWIDHVKRLWPEPSEHEYFFDYCAHMIQRPHEKCNAGVVLSGEQRIGKDAVLHALKIAIGFWNAKDVDPDELFKRFKPWMQTMMLTINEVRPSKDEFHASSMYNILKPLLASPPMTLPMEDKNDKLKYVINVMRVFITTNDYMAMYIPPGDGRLFIMNSSLEFGWQVKAGLPDYFVDLYSWIENGGAGHVARWLASRDISHFNPKGEVAKTAGWEAVSGTWDEPDDCVAYALEAMGKPDVLFGTELAHIQFEYQEDMQAMLKSPRKLGHRMQRAGYVLVKPPADGERWRFHEDGVELRSRTAFVRTRAALTNETVMAAIKQRGKELVSAMKNSRRVTKNG